MTWVGYYAIILQFQIHIFVLSCVVLGLSLSTNHISILQVLPTGGAEGQGKTGGGEKELTLPCLPLVSTSSTSALPLVSSCWIPIFRMPTPIPIHSPLGQPNCPLSKTSTSFPEPNLHPPPLVSHKGETQLEKFSPSSEGSKPHSGLPSHRVLHWEGNPLWHLALKASGTYF